MMTGKELATACLEVAQDHKTIYVMGCFGAPLTGANVERYCNNHSYNRQATRTAMIKAVANQTPPYYGFDCCNLIKGVLWGWSGDPAKTYGGAKYQSNGVPDYSADQLIKECADISTDFSNIEVGEAVWIPGHIGVYVGNGKVVESTPRWENGVQVTSCNRSIQGLHRRNWEKHGKLPYVEYSVENVEKPQEPETPSETVHIVKEGETLSGIAKKYGTTVQALAEYNGIENPDLIFADQVIKIPGTVASKPETPSETVHIVKEGETLSGIAKKYGKTVKAIAEYNGIKNPDLIFVDQVIKIPG